MFDAARRFPAALARLNFRVVVVRVWVMLVPLAHSQCRSARNMPRRPTPAAIPIACLSGDTSSRFDDTSMSTAPSNRSVRQKSGQVHYHDRPRPSPRQGVEPNGDVTEQRAFARLISSRVQVKPSRTRYSRRRRQQLLRSRTAAPPSWHFSTG